jgi:hypothetical protein
MKAKLGPVLKNYLPFGNIKARVFVNGIHIHPSLIFEEG